MCTPASLILTKDEVFWSKNFDSYEDIIAEFNISTDGPYESNMVKVEIVPPKASGRYGRDYSRRIDEWIYKINQDIVPPWYNKEEGKRRTREAAKEWVKAKV